LGRVPPARRAASRGPSSRGCLRAAPRIIPPHHFFPEESPLVKRLLFAVTAPVLMISAAVKSVLADDAPAPPPPQVTWIGKGQFGFLDSKGNSDSESINGNLDLLRYDGAWKNEFYLAGLYGKNSGIVSAERFEGREQTNYNFTKDFFVFGGLRYEHDEFDGFVYQASATSGVGYNLINTPADQLTTQIGAGFRRIRPEAIDKDADGVVYHRQPLEVQSGAIGTATVNYTHKFNPSTALTNTFLAEAGSQNTMVQDNIQLAVKMSTKLALTVGYGVTDNSNPPAPLKKIDTTSTVNLQYSF
jgi:putative salt-induced outer membrane protein